MKVTQPRVETMIDPDTCFQGDVQTQGSVRIDGRVEGNITADGLFLGESGEVQGDISAKTVIISGKVVGNIFAEQYVELHPQGQIYGDIKAAKLSIAEGAVYEGKCAMLARENGSINI